MCLLSNVEVDGYMVEVRVMKWKCGLCGESFISTASRSPCPRCGETVDLRLKGVVYDDSKRLEEEKQRSERSS